VGERTPPGNFRSAGSSWDAGRWQRRQAKLPMSKARTSESRRSACSTTTSGPSTVAPPLTPRTWLTGGGGDVAEERALHAGGDGRVNDLLLEGVAFGVGETGAIVTGFDRVRVTAGALVVAAIVEVAEEAGFGLRVALEFRVPECAVEVETQDGCVAVEAEEVTDGTERWNLALAG
jgi:hypothetical protein